jgi:hypothetical protein
VLFVDTYAHTHTRTPIFYSLSQAERHLRAWALPPKWAKEFASDRALIQLNLAGRIHFIGEKSKQNKTEPIVRGGGAFRSLVERKTQGRDICAMGSLVLSPLSVRDE